MRQRPRTGLARHVDRTLTARTPRLRRHHPHLLSPAVLHLDDTAVLYGQSRPHTAAAHHLLLLLLHGKPLLHHMLRHLNSRTLSSLHSLLLSWHPLNCTNHGGASRPWRPLDVDHARGDVPSLPATWSGSGSGHSSSAWSHRPHSSGHHPGGLLTFHRLLLLLNVVSLQHVVLPRLLPDALKRLLQAETLAGNSLQVRSVIRTELIAILSQGSLLGIQGFSLFS